MFANRKHWKPNRSSRGQRSALKTSTEGIFLTLILQIQEMEYFKESGPDMKDEILLEKEVKFPIGKCR